MARSWQCGRCLRSWHPRLVSRFDIPSSPIMRLFPFPEPSRTRSRRSYSIDARRRARDRPRGQTRRSRVGVDRIDTQTQGRRMSRSVRVVMIRSSANSDRFQSVGSTIPHPIPIRTDKRGRRQRMPTCREIKVRTLAQPISRLFCLCLCPHRSTFRSPGLFPLLGFVGLVRILSHLPFDQGRSRCLFPLRVGR